jgi:YgiT-type zinc finger domain-containing protein
MFRCHVCGATQSRNEILNEVFQIDGQPVQVDNVPVIVCARCGEITVSRETTEAVRRLVHGGGKPARVVQMAVFAYT